MIFILGQGRSGTTLLNRILSAHPRIGFINDEFNSLYWFCKKQSSYDRYGEKKYWCMAVDFSQSFELRKRQIVLPKDVFLSIDNFYDWYQVLLNYYCPSRDYAGIKIANNTKGNLEMIKNEFIDAYCLHIIRDPRDVFLSTKRTPTGTHSPFYFGKSWLEAVGGIEKMRFVVPHYHEIYYEMLIAEPENELKNLCAWLDIEYSSKMLNFFENSSPKSEKYHQLLSQPIVRNNFNKWQKELSQNQLELIYAACGDKMRELGYLKDLNRFNISFFGRLTQYLYAKILFYFSIIKIGKIFFYRERRYNLIDLAKILKIRIKSENRY